MAKITKASVNKKKAYSIGDKEVLYFSPEEFKVYAQIFNFQLFKNDASGALSCKAFKTEEDYKTGNRLFNFKVHQGIDLTKPLCISLQKGNLEDACLLNSKPMEQTVLKTF